MSDVYQQMTDRIMLTGSKLIPELFRMVVDPDEARLLLAMASCACSVKPRGVAAKRSP